MPVNTTKNAPARLPTCFAMLAELDIDVSQNQQVERGVLAHYASTALKVGARKTDYGAVCSALPLRQLYEEDTLVTEFDRRPLSLKQNNFYAKFEYSIEALFSA